MNTDVRAVAAQALDQIARGGVSLRSAFAQAAPRLADARDRALLSALLHEGARWWLRYDAVLDRLLQKPLRGREPVVHALLVLGLVQLAVLGLPEYAAVAGTVEAARALKRPQLAGLVNAVLRRFLRERAALDAAVGRDRVAHSAHPPWLVQELAADWPDDIDAVLAANNAAAALTLRVNRRRASRADLVERLLAAGHAAAPHAWLADAVVLEESTDVTALPGYAQGHFSVQDGAAQLAPELLDLADGQRVLDACAAPGGKTAHCLEHHALDLLALDRDPERLNQVRDNLARLGLQATLAAGDAAEPQAWWDGRPFDRILLDAPCSATGVIRRQPDIRLHRRGGDIARLAAEQQRLLDALWPLLRPGGRLVYATCSVLRRENQQQIEAFLARTPQAAARAAVPPRFGRAAGAGRQNLPGGDGMDGFFYAIVEKQA
ncbi:16S rRNA (cytosine(967)-C(5))-methyltransferase RsmB [Tahibacter harae]|uniref:16S rRNA (cytosine(967)-C(5))-methyltransferase n=1 Tax=Tahibacter harae TaxID=2963937 RepID=A0ABT1QPB9_9GAMM|nr:16S rRNA (cytosine(967)-C(5))-methyltransferase RsmB [Tahibacter harae]MCQ4164132.1 16S rRNA (cytosine(967)-C(5))-methyltransferase RsmB [Tahibacter harae]